MIINGPDGTSVAVNDLNKFEVRSISEAIQSLHNRAGLGFNILSGEITVADANEHALLYFKNTGTDDFIITSYGVMGGKAAGTLTAASRVHSIRNPTAGTLVDSGSDITPLNFNAGKDTVLDATIKGADTTGRTITDGTDPWLATTKGSSEGVSIVDVTPLIIPQGNSIAITFQGQTGTTSQIVRAFIVGYRNSLFAATDKV